MDRCILGLSILTLDDNNDGDGGADADAAEVPDVAEGELTAGLLLSPPVMTGIAEPLFRPVEPQLLRLLDLLLELPTSTPDVSCTWLPEGVAAAGDAVVELDGEDKGTWWPVEVPGSPEVVGEAVTLALPELALCAAEEKAEEILANACEAADAAAWEAAATREEWVCDVEWGGDEVVGTGEDVAVSATE